jgi:hypothetical protein
VLHYQCTYEKINSAPNLNKWCCTNADCDASLDYGECPSEFLLIPYFIIDTLDLSLILSHPLKIKKASDPPLQSDKCENEGYRSIDNGVNCYRLITEMKTWSEAKAYCEKEEKARLITITDGFEQAFMRLITYGNHNPWIGLYQDGSGEYQWSDMWPVQYTNLHPDNIRNNVTTCSFIDSNTGYWYETVLCEQKREFICKITQGIIVSNSDESSSDGPLL